MYFSVRLPDLGINVSFFEGGKEGELMDMLLPNVPYLLLGEMGTKCMKALECHSAPNLVPHMLVSSPHIHPSPLQSLTSTACGQGVCWPEKVSDLKSDVSKIVTVKLQVLVPGRVTSSWERLKAGEWNEMVGWHLWLNEREFEQAPGDGEGQGSLACCCPWGQKSQTWMSDWTTIETESRRESTRCWGEVGIGSH